LEVGLDLFKLVRQIGKITLKVYDLLDQIGLFFCFIFDLRFQLWDSARFDGVYLLLERYDMMFGLSYLALIDLFLINLALDLGL
jgi:hypothetical protein